MLQLPVEVDEAAAVKCWIRIWPPLEVSNSELEQRPLCKRKERTVSISMTSVGECHFRVTRYTKSQNLAVFCRLQALPFQNNYNSL